MKYVTMFLLSVFTFLVLVFGQTHWSNLIEQTVAMENEYQQTEQKIEKEVSSSFETIKDNGLKSALEKAVSKHEKANILIAGSEALGDRIVDWG